MSRKSVKKKDKEGKRKLLKRTLRVTRKKKRESDKCVTRRSWSGDRTAVRRFIFFSFVSRKFKLIVVRAKMNLSVCATILCVLVVVLLSETAYIRPPDWHLRYGFEENQVRFLKKTAAFETLCPLLGEVALFKML